MVNQLELHPFYQRENKLSILREYGKTVALIILRWNVQRDVGILLKSIHRDRIEKNLDVWNFGLLTEDMRQIASLDFAVRRCLTLANRARCIGISFFFYLVNRNSSRRR